MSLDYSDRGKQPVVENIETYETLGLSHYYWSHYGIIFTIFTI